MTRYSRFSRTEHAALHAALRRGDAPEAIQKCLGATEEEIAYHRTACAAVDAHFSDWEDPPHEKEEKPMTQAPINDPDPIPPSLDSDRKVPPYPQTPEAKAALYAQIRAGADLHALAAETGVPFTSLRSMRAGLAMNDKRRQKAESQHVSAPKDAAEGPPPLEIDALIEALTRQRMAWQMRYENEVAQLQSRYEREFGQLRTAWEEDMNNVTRMLELLRHKQQEASRPASTESHAEA